MPAPISGESSLYKVVVSLRELWLLVQNVPASLATALADILALQSDLAALQSQVGITTGTFTPALAFGGASTGITYDSRSGAHLKIGSSLLFVSIAFDLSSKGSAVGAATITGLPFNGQNGLDMIEFAAGAGFVAVGAERMYARTNVGTGVLSVIHGVGTGNVDMDNTHFANNSIFSASGLYRIT